MPDVLRNVNRGERLSSLSAAQINLWNDAARATRGNRFDNTFDAASVTRSSAIIDIRNKTGGSLERFTVVALDGMGVTPATNENEALARPFMEGFAPGYPSDRESIAILLDPINADAIGRAVLLGAIWVQVSVGTGEEDYRFADVSNGITSYMVMKSRRGPATILWKESGTGMKWAFVELTGANAIAVGGDNWTWTDIKTDDYTAAVGEAVPVRPSLYLSKGILGATNAAPIKITKDGNHNAQTGDVVTISGVLGNTAANGTWTITYVSATEFTLNTSDGTASGVWTSGGLQLASANGPTIKLPDFATSERNDKIMVVVLGSDRTSVTALMDVDTYSDKVNGTYGSATIFTNAVELTSCYWSGNAFVFTRSDSADVGWACEGLRFT